ncbi:hypothetical protein MNBD_GAMMA12-2811 [hydrothermal vent metagenome]|uniref:Uncharacterized protein n=1 Tax=hydrothermal vent metagenome TaxID=652676 RepID=A0A3B0ZJD1_9ZZZZ
MKNLKSKGLVAFGLASLCLIFTSQSIADNGGISATNATPKPWIVTSNGSSYVKFDHLGMVTIVGNVQYSTDITGRIKSWWTYPKMTNGYGIALKLPSLAAYKNGKTYSPGNRPKTINETVAMSIPSTVIASHAIGMCEFQAIQLRNKGLSNQQIFSQDREVSFEVVLEYSVDANGAGSSNPLMQAQLSPYIIKVRCAKWAGSTVPTTTNFDTGLVVSNAVMTHKTISALNGACKVKLTTRLTTNKRRRFIRFRYVSKSGKKSRIFKVRTGPLKRAHVTHTWNLVNSPGPLDGTDIHMEGVSPPFKSNVVAAYTQCSEAGPASLSGNQLRVLSAVMQSKMINAMNGACKVKLTTMLRANKPNSIIRFRYRSREGKQSKVFTTMTNPQKMASITHTWNIENAPSVFDGTTIRMIGTLPKFQSNIAVAYTECRQRTSAGTTIAGNPKKPTVNKSIRRSSNLAAPKNRPTNRKLNKFVAPKRRQRIRRLNKRIVPKNKTR